MRSAARWKSSTSSRRSLSGRSVELISVVTKYFCAACLDSQCRSTKCTAIKTRATILHLNKFNANCALKYVNVRVPTTGNEPSSGDRLSMDLEKTMEYAPRRKNNPPWVHPHKMDPSQLDEH